MKVLLDAIYVAGEPVQLILIPQPENEAEREDWPDAAYYFELSNTGLAGSAAKLVNILTRLVR